MNNKNESILNLIAWNANGLKPAKLLEFSEKMAKLRVDIALFSETHFARESRGYLKGYRFYNSRHPSNNARGEPLLLSGKTLNTLFSKL